MSDVNLAPQKKKGKAAGAHRAVDPIASRAEGDPLSRAAMRDPLSEGGHGGEALHRAAAPTAGKKGKKKAAAAGRAA